jgi:hypothetical protein
LKDFIFSFLKSNIASAGEAEWFVREMNRAYGRL